MDIPRYMNIGQFCECTGLSRWNFKRISDRHHLHLIPQGTNKLLEVEPAIEVLATIPGIELLLSAKGMEFVRQVQEAQVPDRSAGTPQEAAE
jgi:hypothetical protein